nr:MAG TPA: hypothetical protein [Caudoviricetes sp.]
MKIDEFVEKLNELKSLRAEKKSDGILIYSKQSTGYDFFISLAYRTKSLADVGFDWGCLKNVGPVDLHKALNLVDCFIHTPIKERYPEKKYRLRWFKDLNGASNCLNYIDGEWTCSDIHYANQYSQRELEKLKKENPRLAPAIDAMKEPVEDD